MTVRPSHFDRAHRCGVAPVGAARRRRRVPGGRATDSARDDRRVDTDAPRTGLGSFDRAERDAAEKRRVVHCERALHGRPDGFGVRRPRRAVFAGARSRAARARLPRRATRHAPSAVGSTAETRKPRRSFRVVTHLFSAPRAALRSETRADARASERLPLPSRRRAREPRRGAFRRGRPPVFEIVDDFVAREAAGAVRRVRRVRQRLLRDERAERTLGVLLLRVRERRPVPHRRNRRRREIAARARVARGGVRLSRRARRLRRATGERARVDERVDERAPRVERTRRGSI